MERARWSAVVLAGVAALSAAACGSSTDDASRPVTVAGETADCPGDVVRVVVSVAQWRDMAEQLGGDCATVTTVLASAAADPHDFEPRPADIAAFEDADLAVLNGAGYDTWAADAVGNLDPEPDVVSAAEVAGDADGEPADPHLWYDPEALERMAGAITDRLVELSPGAAEVFTARAGDWAEQMGPYRDELAALRATAAGRTYAATEAVFDPTAAAVGLRDATPEGYRSAVANESDPAPGDIAAFESALSDGEVDVLVYNTQTEGRLPEQLRATAEDAGVPVVEVTESPQDADGSFVSWQLDQLRELSTALGT